MNKQESSYFARATPARHVHSMTSDRVNMQYIVVTWKKSLKDSRPPTLEEYNCLSAVHAEPVHNEFGAHWPASPYVDRSAHVPPALSGGGGSNTTISVSGSPDHSHDAIAHKL